MDTIKKYKLRFLKMLIVMHIFETYWKRINIPCFSGIEPDPHTDTTTSCKVRKLLSR